MVSSSFSSIPAFLTLPIITTSPSTSTSSFTPSVSFHPQHVTLLKPRESPLRCTIAPERPVSTTTTAPYPNFPPSHSSLSKVQSHAVPGLPDWRYVGPPLSDGDDITEAYPTIVYFALTATQSLELDPFNQLVTATPLSLDKVRIFSPTLPFHSDEDMQVNEQVFHQWASVYSNGGDLISTFIRRADNGIRHLISKGYCTDNAVHVAGLSRGGLLAGLLAAHCEFIESCLLFAPVTSLSSLSEMEQLVSERNAKVQRADLCRHDIVQNLIHVPVRVYMGNMDRRVGTKQAFEFAHLLAETADQHGVRSSPHEFIMYCSVGKHGHGTPTDVFEAGAQFLLSQIEDVNTNNRRKRRSS